VDCPYCRSENIVLVDGEYVCKDCGSVIGPEVVPPRVKQINIIIPKRRIMLILLEKETKEGVKKRYGEVVEFYITKITSELGREDIGKAAMKMFRKLDKRIYQGKSPRVIAAALFYLAAEQFGFYVHKQTIAKILGISKFSIRDTASRLRKYVSHIIENS
jgi:transcription initiation factor TFIIIB Brf1 subunit/transcription initiation factor TFIIB